MACESWCGCPAQACASLITQIPYSRLAVARIVASTQKSVAQPAIRSSVISCCCRTDRSSVLQKASQNGFDTTRSRSDRSKAGRISQSGRFVRIPISNEDHDVPSRTRTTRIFCSRPRLQPDASQQVEPEGCRRGRFFTLQVLEHFTAWQLPVAG